MTVVRFLELIEEIYDGFLDRDKLFIEIIDNSLLDDAINPLLDNSESIKKIISENSPRPIPKEKAKYIADKFNETKFVNYIKQFIRGAGKEIFRDQLYNHFLDEVTEISIESMTKDNLEQFVLLLWKNLLNECKNAQQTRPSRKKEKQATLSYKDIREKLKEVVYAIPNFDINDRPSRVKDPKHSKEKIGSPECKLLYRKVEPNVTEYFDDVRDLFKARQETPNFLYERVKEEVHNKFESISDLPKPEVFQKMVSWLQEETRGSYDACEIIISYFIQSCEVFYASTK